MRSKRICRATQRRWGRALLVATVAVAVLLMAATALAATQTITVTQASVNKTSHQVKQVTLRQGEKLRIAFVGNWYDSGYRWMLTLKPSRSELRYLGSKTIAPKGCCGRPETIYYTYDTVGHGTTTFIYTLTGPGGKTKGKLTISAKA